MAHILTKMDCTEYCILSITINLAFIVDFVVGKDMSNRQGNCREQILNFSVASLDWTVLRIVPTCHQGCRQFSLFKETF